MEKVVSEVVSLFSLCVFCCNDCIGLYVGKRECVYLWFVWVVTSMFPSTSIV